VKTSSLEKLAAFVEWQAEFSHHPLPDFLNVTSIVKTEKAYKAMM
jgi:hypothetical protein